MTTIKANNRVLQFVTNFNDNVSKYKQKIDSCNQRISDIALEMKYINDVELKEAIEIRLLEDDNSQEKKVRKHMDKLEAELKQMHEELPVLHGILKKYIIKAGEEAIELNNFYVTEKQLQEQKAVAHMLHAKKVYTDEIIKQSAIIREVNSVDTKLQEILYATGKKNGVYTFYNIPKSVQLSEKELIGLVKGTSNNDYLSKYSNMKNL
jgi:hypothetical protein